MTNSDRYNTDESLAAIMTQVAYDVDYYGFMDPLPSTYDTTEEALAAGTEECLGYLKNDRQGALRSFLDSFNDDETKEALSVSENGFAIEAISNIQKLYDKEFPKSKSYGSNIDKFMNEPEDPSLAQELEYMHF